MCDATISHKGETRDRKINVWCHIFSSGVPFFLRPLAKFWRPHVIITVGREECYPENCISIITETFHCLNVSVMILLAGSGLFVRDLDSISGSCLHIPLKPKSIRKCVTAKISFSMSTLSNSKSILHNYVKRKQYEVIFRERSLNKL